MKRIILVLISVVMLFTACENTLNDSDTNQTNPFDNITLRMTVVEFIDTVGRQPDSIVKALDHDRYDECYIYKNEEFFGVNAHYIKCYVKDYELDRIEAWYEYDDELEEEQDYLTLKEEILKRYPEGVLYSDYYDEREFSIEMEHYDVYLYYMDHTIMILISDFLKSTES